MLWPFGIIHKRTEPFPLPLPQKRARCAAAQCQLTLADHDRVHYPLCKKLLEASIHTLCQATAQSPPTCRGNICESCAIFVHGKPQFLWPPNFVLYEIPACRCQANDRWLKITRIYGNILEVLGGHNLVSERMGVC